LGAQFSWILRPFFGTPSQKIQFLRDHPMKGNFYESIWGAIERTTGGNGLPALIFIVLILLIPIAKSIQSNHQTKPTP
ncbi:MAG TPA: hypothetical protein VF258_02620, partial [Luteolibacter sp.]